jgi:hypothetical protein
MPVGGYSNFRSNMLKQWGLSWLSGRNIRIHVDCELRVAASGLVLCEEHFDESELDREIAIHHVRSFNPDLSRSSVSSNLP